MARQIVEDAALMLGDNLPRRLVNPGRHMSADGVYAALAYIYYDLRLLDELLGRTVDDAGLGS